MRICKIEISLLFGHFNYVINLDDKVDFVRIITAPNGYGKSTILNIINSFINNDFSFFIDLDFKEVNFYLSKLDSPITILKNRYKYKSDSVLIKLNEHKTLIDKHFFDDVSSIDSGLPIIYKGDLWESFDGEELSLKDVLYRFKGHYKIEKLYNNTRWLYDITSQMVINHISTNRLFSRRKSSYHYEEEDMLMIFSVQENIKAQLQNSLNEYSLEGRRRENSFPKRLLPLINDNQKDIRVRIDRINSLISEIREAELNLEKIGVYNEITENNDFTSELLSEISGNVGLSVLEVYLEDRISKLNKFRPILRKIIIFKETLDKLLSFKKIRFSLEKGFEIYSTLKRKAVIPLSELSSGEQHLVLLLGSLIFNTKKGALVLIDEPEISFHSSWQLDFIAIIKDIQKIHEFSLIIATHAFTLIDQYWDDTIELAEQYEY